MSRIVVWFSCGAPSAVAAKMTLAKQEAAEIVYCETRSEHPDNERFIRDCETWFDRRITRISSTKYEDVWDVWEKTRFIVSPKGARCSTELKKIPRMDFQESDDWQLYGFTVEEQDRADLFRANNPEINFETPLIEAGLTKADCKGILRGAGIELPIMYKLGFNNNNCPCCPKGGMGYWNKLRVEFPANFERMAKLSRELGVRLHKYRGEYIFLDELPPDAGDYPTEPAIECSLLCQIVEQDFLEQKP